MKISFGGAYLLRFKNKEISDSMYELYSRRIREENVKNHCCCRPDTSKISPEVVKYNDTQLLILTGKDKQESDEIFELSAFFLTYIGYPSTEVGNCEAFLGISDRVAQRLFYDSINCIYSDRPQNERETIIKKISLYGYIWLAAKTYIFEPQNLKRLNHCRDEVVRLLKEVDTLNF